MNISSAAKASGLPVKTVRYYADIGLVDAPSRSEAGYRSYDDASVRKLAFVRRSREFGFSIEECRELLSLYQDRDRTSADVDLLRKSGEHQLNGQEVFNVPWKQTDAGISA